MPPVQSWNWNTINEVYKKIAIFVINLGKKIIQLYDTYM